MYMYYRFKVRSAAMLLLLYVCVCVWSDGSPSLPSPASLQTNAELVRFQNCQSEQKLFIDKVYNPGYKTPLNNPPKYSRC